MYDQIRGKVSRIIDGDTFDLNVTHFSRKNRYNYDNYERIRIASFDARELGSAGGLKDRITLALKLNSKFVLCSIKSRDVFGRLVADVTIIG